MFRTSSPILVCTILVGGCSENGLSLREEKEELAPGIEVHPTELDFGDLGAGEEDIKTFVVNSVGTTSLRVEDVHLVSPDSFAILTEETELTLPQGAYQEFEVWFSPDGSGDYEGTVYVTSDATEDPVEVALIGGMLGPELEIEPDPLDFGQNYVQCEATDGITLRNVGEADLEITAIDFLDLSGAFAFVDPNTLPLTLAPAGEAPLQVTFLAPSAGTFASTLSVTSNDPRGVLQATQIGEAIYVAQITDTFVVPEDPPIDIVFAIDQSGSMDTHASNLAANFLTFINQIGAVTSGWRIGVVTMDTACFNGGVLTATTPNLTTVFSDAVQLGTDSTCAYDEKLFTLVEMALAKTGSGQCNQNFLRAGALLHVVFVSDEWEQSASSSYSASMARGLTFVSNGQVYASSSSLFKVSGIICSDGGCGIADGYPYGYREAIAATGGTRLDIMSSNWGASASALADASLTGLGRFELSQTADENTIVVTVNGIPLPSTDWYFEPTTNEVVLIFPAASGSTVQIAYGVLGICP